MSTDGVLGLGVGVDVKAHFVRRPPWRLRLARFLAEPERGIEQLDRVSRLWPLSACFGVFAFVAARAVIEGQTGAAVIFSLLSTAFLGALAWVLHVSGGDPGAGGHRRR